MAGTCVADLPTGVKITVRTSYGLILNGRVTANHGADIEVLCDDGSLHNVSNDCVLGFSITDKESQSAYRANQSKKAAEFAQLLARIKS